eukprot:XP_011421602.1 PREDICTED: uncharacterized protein LOC105324248 [Crassostrea gigas]
MQEHRFCLAVMVLMFSQLCQSLEEGGLQQGKLQSLDMGRRSWGHAKINKDFQTVVGEFNKHDDCWESGPDNVDLSVRDERQSVGIRFIIGYLLRKNPFVEYAIKSRHRQCDHRQSFATLGLQSSCPSELSFPTKVKFLGKRCYVVQPEKQCVTYAKCSEKSPCHNGFGTGSERSKCLQDNFRTFHVWVYCERFGFRLIQLNLPQCCSCNKFSLCVVSPTTPPGTTGPTIPQN